jgi:hypothetical protein
LNAALINARCVKACGKLPSKLLPLLQFPLVIARESLSIKWHAGASLLDAGVARFSPSHSGPHH